MGMCHYYCSNLIDLYWLTSFIIMDFIFMPPISMNNPVTVMRNVLEFSITGMLKSAISKAQIHNGKMCPIRITTVK